MIAIFFLQKRMGGGTTQFTAHLVRGFQRMLERDLVKLFRVNPNYGLDDISAENFGEFDGITITSIGSQMALRIARTEPSILTAPTSPENLPRGFMTRFIKAGAVPVLHDRTQLHLYPHKLKRAICIRPTMREVHHRAVFIRHPYTRLKHIEDVTEKKSAISTARVHNTKRTQLILQANRLLPKKHRVKIIGAEFRLYSYGLMKKYGDVFEQQGGDLQFPLNFTYAVEQCARYRYNVDFTKLPEDGGGSQYCQLEAMDAGCVNIMHEDWFAKRGDLVPGIHIITVASPEELADIIQDESEVQQQWCSQIANNCYKLLDKHEASQIAYEYAAYMQR